MIRKFLQKMSLHLGKYEIFTSSTYYFSHYRTDCGAVHLFSKKTNAIPNHITICIGRILSKFLNSKFFIRVDM